MLQLKNIKKDYVAANNTVQALKGVSLRFRKNEFVSILGASGCGKTTLLNIIGGLDHYTSGDLVINGISTKDYKDRDWDVYRNHRIGFVFQSYNLIPHQTVLGNVELALTIAGLSKTERRRRAEEALYKVGLGAELRKRPNQLSGGQMQRVAIARALVNNPEILLADEPTGALDTTTSIQIMELIREIAGERLVIMVTHNPEIAEEYSSRIVRLQDGLVISDTNPYYGEEEGVVLKQVDAREVPQNAKVETRLQRTMPCPYCGETLTVETDGSIVEGDFTCPHCNNVFRIGKKVKYYKKPEEQPVLTRKQRRAMEKANKAAAKESRKKEKKERSSMSFKTSLGLSARNLLSKKGRTALTSIAGSIGIISVCLVLALSNGFNNYILKTQEDMLSAYPITISKNSVNLNNIADKMTSISDLPDMDRLDDKVYVNSVLSNLAQGMTLVNDLSRGEGSYIEYIESMDESMYAAMQYDYGMNVFSKIYTSVTLGGVGKDAPETEEFRSLSSIKQTYKTKLSLMNAEYAQIDYLVDFLPSVIGKIPDTQDMSKANCLAYVQSQYDKLAGEWPTQANDAVLVIGDNNEMFDLTLAQLGFISEKDFLELFDEEKQTSLDVDFDTIYKSSIISRIISIIPI
ncbi:MAG: ATP-binding cassette domain-containing protein [Clostridia bacterium]|nr:ATP-binding cassette domain-containing protein [Clostridia bacterium]